MEKLEIYAIDPTERGNSKELTLCIKLTDKWCKPLKDIGYGFDDVIKDQNKGIQMALWRFDSEKDKKVDLLFDPNEQLDDFQRRALKDFIDKKRG